MKIVNALFLVILFVSNVAFGGRVRNLPTSSKDMPVIQLMTGRSTVLRFPFPPKKVVLGNQNYFNVEFIDSDVTLQPLGVSSSNLFVYGDGFTYGFLLKVGRGPDYDDLVLVHSKYSARVDEPTEPEKTAIPRPKPKPSLPFELTKLKPALFEMEGGLFKWNDHAQIYFGDIFIKSKRVEAPACSSIKVQLIQKAKDILKMPPVFDCEKIGTTKCRFRLFADPLPRTPTRLIFTYKGLEYAFDLKWEK